VALKYHVEFKGHQRTIANIILADGSSPAVEFLAEFVRDERQKIDVLFERMGQFGEIQNRQKFKKLERTDGLFAFKSFQIRLPCFLRRHRMVYLLFGLRKQSNAWKPSEVRRAEEYRSWAVVQNLVEGETNGEECVELLQLECA
jgi:hypothetical protein